MNLIQRLVAALLVLAAIAFSQSPRGVLVGTVSDPSGAAVANTIVTITNQGTNASVRVQTNDIGQYTASNLDPGTYSVSVEQQGFRAMTVRDIVLQVSQTARVDVSLTVGDVASTVTVDATAPVVQSETSSIGSVVDNRQVQNLPLNGRSNISALLSLTPGVQRSGINPVVSAASVWFGSTNMTIDGAANIDFGNERLGPTVPSLEAIGEFRVIANAASAEYGRGGTQIIVATRAGTNELHGSLFAYNRNRALSAKNFFATHLPKPAFNRNEYGGSLGGPILKNKLFYFGSFEGMRRIGSATVVSAMPTPALKSGDFTGLAPVRDPLTGENFANNRIPADRISPFAREMLKFAADPNTATTAAAGLGNNYTWNSPQREINDRYSFRLDHHLTDKDRINGRYWQANNGPFQNSGGEATERFGNFVGWGAATKSVMASYTRLVTASMINEARFAFMHNNFFRTPQNSDLDPSTFIPGLTSPLPGLGGLPEVRINGFRGFIDLAGSGDRQRNWEFYDNLSWNVGSHNLKVGGEWQRASSLNRANLAPSRGQFLFDGRYTGNPFADFLLGYPFRTQRPTRNVEVEPQNSRWAGFIQDDWVVSPKLTLNLGLRYEYAGLFQNSIGDIANFDPALGKLVLISGTPDPSFAGLPIVNGSEIGLTADNYVNKDRNNFAPRFGFAYRPFGRSTFVIRSGYGIFYNVNPGYLFGGALPQNPPFRTSQLFDALPGNTPSLTMANPFPGTGSVTANPNVNAFARDRVNGYMQQWNFTVEGEVLPNTAVRASYLGNRGVHLDRLININEPLPAPGLIQPRRPYQPFGNIMYRESGRNSLLNQLQLGAIRRLSNGFSFQVEYQLTNALGEQPYGIEAPMSQWNARLDWGHADFIRRHVVTANYTWDLPFGRGRALELSGFANALFGGWRLNGILSKGTGEPFSVGFNSTVTGWPSNRADIVGDPYANARTLTRWFNPDAFAVPAPFTFGNSPRNVLWGPGYFTWDTSLIKNTAITERVNFEFRAEFFNVLNHASFNAPAANISVPNQVGRITSTFTGPRDIQFGARLSF
jgi:outer membrane receptor protein involved in Fe transport